jgi:hypothetical protein
VPGLPPSSPSSKARTSDSRNRRCPPGVRMLLMRPAAAHRVTVFGSTRNSAATSPGVSRRSPVSTTPSSRHRRPAVGHDQTARPAHAFEGTYAHYNTIRPACPTNSNSRLTTEMYLLTSVEPVADAHEQARCPPHPMIRGLPHDPRDHAGGDATRRVQDSLDHEVGTETRCAQDSLDHEVGDATHRSIMNLAS